MNASGLIVDGLALPVPGLTVRNFHDDPALVLPREDGTARGKHEVTCVTLHSTLGAPDRDLPHPQTLITGLGPSSDVGRALVDLWGTDHRCAGAHLAVDFDRMIYCLCDLLRWESFHAKNVNPRSIGIEYRQGRAKSEFYGEQLSAGRTLVDWITIDFGIQRQIPLGYKGRPARRIAAGAADFFGVFGHRDQSDNRGAGDPGDFIMASLRAAGYEAFDVDACQDLDTWKRRQAWLGLDPHDQDGIPGSKTREALRDRGFVGGIWTLPPANANIPAELLTRAA